MFRRRRRSSVRYAGRGGGGKLRLILAGLAGVLVIGGFFYAVHVADQTTPERREARIDLPNVFKD